MLSRDCDGCPQLRECAKRYQKAFKGDKVYCPDGTAHLVDDSSTSQDVDLDHVCLEPFQT
jgi:hypothetical protein